jgi:hypothetical protein
VIELIDTNASGIAAEFVASRLRSGSPAMSMVMTLIIVVDEDGAEDAMRAARQASHEHPARVLGVILGNARGEPQINAQVGTGAGWTGETALIRLHGDGGGHPRQEQGHPPPVLVVRPGQHRPGLDPDHPVARVARRGTRPAAAEGDRWLGDRRADQPERGTTRGVAV